jgi:hypothetical protein
MKKVKSLLALGAILVLTPAPLWADDDGYVRSVTISERFFDSPRDPIRLPKPVDPASWTSAADFPAEIEPRNLRVNTNVMIAVSADGAVQSCKGSPRAAISAGTLYEQALYDWVAVACKIVTERGKFVPAINAEGDRIGVEINIGVEFLMHPADASEDVRPMLPPPSRDPRDIPGPNLSKGPQLLEPLALNLADSAITNDAPRVVLDLSESGRINFCRIVESTGSDKGDAEVCRYLRDTGFSPRLDRQGQPVADSYFRLTVPITPP